MKNSGDLDPTQRSYDMMGFIPSCGCGIPDEIAEVVHWTLTMFGLDPDTRDDAATDSFKRWLGNNAGGLREVMFWVFLSALDDKGLLEHGTTIRYSWLTDTGRAFLDFLNEHGPYSDAWPGVSS